MFTRKVTLFNLFGFAIQVDATWIVLALLITWSLAAHLFPASYPDLDTAAYWWMGAAGALGIFLSIVVHEVGHSLVARRFGLPITEITLFIFGGVANLEEEPPTAKAEFWMAVTGPLTSVGVAALCFAAYLLAGEIADAPALGVLWYLAWMNLLLATFNILPAFPLDGGRVLRAGLWAWRDNLRWATRVASRIGSGFGILLIVLGLLTLFSGGVVGGIWWCLIGLFMRGASHASYRHLLVRRVLEGEPVRRFMKEDPVTVPPHATVHDLVEDYVYKFHYKMFPVVDEGGNLRGCVTTKEVKELDKEEWGRHTVSDLAMACSTETCVRPDTDAMKALQTMNRTGNSRLLVVENGKLAGVLALKDLLGFLSLKLDLEEEPD